MSKTPIKKRVSIPAELYDDLVEAIDDQLESHSVSEEARRRLELSLDGSVGDDARRTLHRIERSIEQYETQFKQIKNLRLGERVAALDTMLATHGKDVHDLTFAVKALAEWRSLTFWARIKSLFIKRK